MAEGSFASGGRSCGGDELERTILRLLDARGPGKSICPSEVARAVAGSADANWRALMDPVRAAAQRLVGEGRVDITQHGKVVDGRTSKGAVRLRLR